MSPISITDEALHSADVEQVAKRLVEVACAETGSRDGAVFLYDPKRDGLTVDFHRVEGVIVALPGTGAVLRKRTDGRPNGIAFTCFERGRAYLCNDTASDPNYASYFRDVASVLAVPIPWQRKAMGVLTVASQEKHAFAADHVKALEAIAQASAKFLRRAAVARETTASGRPFFIKGLSPAWLEVERRIEQVAATDAPVLVQGESGTGKELVSRSIHFNSRRASKPLVSVNCAAIPENLLESVLFGHVKGAFTGATQDKKGEFQKAAGGTLFLDELGEMPLILQAKVLRAIEQGEVTPLGSNASPERVDVRLVCATNRDLAAMVREGKFRDDLYFRVGVIGIELPPLRSYKDNLEILSQVFLQQSAARHERHVTRISREAAALLRAYDFPGNVRELKNAIEHAVIMATGEVLGPEDLPRSMRQSVAVGSHASGSHTSSGPDAPGRHARTLTTSPDLSVTLAEARERWVAPHERAYLLAVLEACLGDVSAAARRAGVNRVTLYRLMKKHGLKVSRRAGDA